VSFRTATLFVLISLCWNCAQQGSPSGGPRDEDPPTVVECEPNNYSIRFEAKKIMITFDEFIVLDNVNQQLVVSPPMEEKPEIKLRKKTLIIQFEEELKDSTTYTFNFGSAIKDLHEGNKLLNYEYVFSTGDVLDSLSVRGTLKYAENLTEPEEPISIMLYNDLRDSVPITDIPLYVGRSDDSGVFSVNNLKADVYKVFALKDGNYNFLFDLPTEEIGFLDSSLIVNAEFARSLLAAQGITDTTATVADSTGFLTDTTGFLSDTTATIADTTGSPAGPTFSVADTADVQADSIAEEGPDFNSITIDMLLFIEENEIQYITDDMRDDRRLIQMFFARPLTDSFHYRFLTPDTINPVETLEIFSSQRDSLSLWLKDSADYKKDTLIMEVNYTVKDTTLQFVTQTDTLIFSFREKKPKQKKTEEEEEEVEKLGISTIRNNGELDLNRNLRLDLDVPLEAIRDSLISFYHIPDTVEIPFPFRTRADSLVPTRAWILADWESLSRYRLLLLPGAVNSIYDLAHDTLDVSFKTRDIEYYGQILLNLENIHNRVIIQLISKENVVRQRTVEQDGLCTFSYLAPQDYQVKFIHDLNGNGRWDTGKYLKKLQPEPVELLPKEITVRSNWDHDVSMRLEK